MVKQPKTKRKEAHCAMAKTGMGDYYGSGIRNPVGRVRDSYMDNQISPRKVGKAPKSLA